MTEFTREGDRLRADWERQQRDAELTQDPTLGDRSGEELAALAERLVDDFDLDLASVSARIRERRRPFALTWPALAFWRQEVLRDPRRHPPHVAAAAFEALALESELAGNPDIAERARTQAEKFIDVRRHPAGDAPHESQDPNTPPPPDSPPEEARAT